MYRVAVCEDEAILCANLCAQCESILDKLKVEHRITSFHLPKNWKMRSWQEKNFRCFVWIF